MKKFEYFTYYKQAPLDFDQISQKINELGSEGWELVSSVPQTTVSGTIALIYTFKREILD